MSDVELKGLRDLIDYLKIRAVKMMDINETKKKKRQFIRLNVPKDIKNCRLLLLDLEKHFKHEMNQRNTFKKQESNDRDDEHSIRDEKDDEKRVKGVKGVSNGVMDESEVEWYSDVTELEYLDSDVYSSSFSSEEEEIVNEPMDELYKMEPLPYYSMKEPMHYVPLKKKFVYIFTVSFVDGVVFIAIFTSISI